MAPRAGPASPALALLCALGSLLLAQPAATQQLSAQDRQKLLSGLWDSAATLSANFSQKERGLPPPPSLSPLCRSACPPPPGRVEPSAFLPLVRAIKPLVLASLPGNLDVDEIIIMLERLQARGTPETPVCTPRNLFQQKLLERLQAGGTPETPVCTPRNLFQQKLLTLTVLQELSDCVRPRTQARRRRARGWRLRKQQGPP